MSESPLANLTETLAGDLHGALRDAASQGPLATDEMTGATGTIATD